MAKQERTRPLREDVRADVLAAAREVFAELGYHRASLESIARRAGYSKGAVYSNFDSKDDLFLALLEPETLQMAQAVAAYEPTGDLRTDLDRIAAGLELLTVATPANLLFAEFRAHAARDPELAKRVAVLRATITEELTADLTGLVERMGGRLRIPARDAVTLLLAVVNGLALERVGTDNNPVPPTSLGALLNGLVEPASAG